MSVRYLERTDAATVNELIATELLGAQVDEFEHNEHDWFVSFSSGARLRIWCEWRILRGDRISLTSADDGQQFGLPAPINGAAKGEELLRDKTVGQIAIRSGIADLTIAFDSGASLEVWNNSSGYEGWSFDAQGFHVVAQGGGQLAIWRPDGEDKAS